MTRHIDAGDDATRDPARAPGSLHPSLIEALLPSVAHRADGAITVAEAERHAPDFEFVAAPYRSLPMLSEVRRLMRQRPSDYVDRDRALGALLARCDVLEEVDLNEIEEVLAAEPPGGARRDEALEHRSLTPWLIAIGESEQARRWSEIDRFGADRRRGDWEDCHADLTEQQIRVAEGRPPADRRTRRDDRASITPPLWYQLNAEVYWRLIEGDTVAARHELDRMAVTRGGVPLGLRGDTAVLETMCEALEGGEGVELAPPEVAPRFADLRTALVSGEAVALGGSRAGAARWSAWFDAHWPAHVLRDPRWPVLAQRVRALLACRAGDLAAARRWMDEAIVIADRIGSPVEAALARIQGAELLVLDGQWGARERWNALLDAGQGACRELRIPYEHHAARVRMAAVLGRFDVMSTGHSDTDPMIALLTSREIEVLRLFSAGHSYRQAAEVLGVGWRTVQSHAYNAYQKLGVSSKIAAVTAASRLQLL